jgi:chromosome partitioning protein
MTIISFANSKGGAGKSTLCLLIASELAEAGTKVLIIDADEQQSCSQWAERCRVAGTLPPAISISRASTPEELKALLQASQAEIVLVDVQGSMNKMLIAAVVASDVTIVPSKANVMEMNETVKLDGIDVNTTAFKDAVQLIRQNNLPAFGTFIRSRKVYEQFSNNAGSLGTIARDPSKTEQVEKARANILSLISDISELLKAEGDAR